MSSHTSIAALAYQLWVERGRPHGSEEEDWLAAERQLSTQADVDASLEETFPASDAPATHAPDVPPANARDKWIAAGSNLPVDETDDAPALAPGDIGEDR